MIQKGLYIIGLLICFSGYSQEVDKEEGETLLRRDFSFGLNFNANSGATGWGMGFEFGVQKNYKYKNTFGFTFTNIRHPKEYKIYSSYSNSRGYYFGKLNSFVSLRPTIGGKLALFNAKRENGIEISFKWNLGPSIGLLKPVYLRIDKLGGNPKDERYDPTMHNVENITSRSSWSKGLSEASFDLGVFAKAGMDFNFSPLRNKISGGELGVMIDYIVGKPVVILYNNPGQNLFASVYLQFNIGQKLY